MDQIGPILEVGITLKLTKTNFFLMKWDYLYSVWVLLCFSNLRLNILLTRPGHS